MKFSTLSIHKRYLENVSIWQEFTTFVNLSADVKQGKTEQKCSFTVTSQNNLEAQQLTSAKCLLSQFDQNKVVPFLSFYLHIPKNATRSKFGLFLAIYAMLLLSGNIEDFNTCRKRTAITIITNHNQSIGGTQLHSQSC